MKAAVYGSTIVLSAFLLFLVQPMIAKALLPFFGGSAAVWATCLVFFQVALLLGYMYANIGSRRLRPKVQAAVHVAVLAASCLLLPLGVPEYWGRLAEWDPRFGVLVALAASVGIPYFALSITSPLVQSWYAGTVNARFPYRLYALSNLGSLGALLAYPVLVEPFIGTRMQLSLWSGGYGAFVLLCCVSALFGSRSKLEPDSVRTGTPARAGAGLWLLLSMTSSALLVAVTNYLCMDVAPVPFLWVMPLALYLLTFVLCFDHDGWYRPSLMKWAVPPALFALLNVFMAVHSLTLTLALSAAGLFLAFMFCHGELARLRPASQHLTNFYFWIALGGALGGTLVAIVAPSVLRTAMEYPIALALCGLLLMNRLFGYGSARALTAVGLVVMAPVLLVVEYQVIGRNPKLMFRNAYGPLSVSEDDTVRTFYHGKILHGLQFKNERRSQPTAYFGPGSGIGITLRHFEGAPRRIGIIGLGVATLAAYGKAGDFVQFYEINPLVEKIARQDFTFLTDSPARTGNILGDARLRLQAQPDQHYDVFVVDAFSGDAIPIHLLTREAFALYYRHLRPDGVLALHISNRFLNLAPVVAALAGDTGRTAVLVTNNPPGGSGELRSTWAIVTDNQAFLKDETIARRAVPIAPSPRVRTWTDDYSNLFRVLK